MPAVSTVPEHGRISLRRYIEYELLQAPSSDKAHVNCGLEPGAQGDCVSCPIPIIADCGSHLARRQNGDINSYSAQSVNHHIREINHPMSRLSRLFDKSNRTRLAENSDTSGWTQIGNASDHLLAELESLYWTGVNQELDCLVSTLRQWQQPQFQDIHPHANERVVNGFDTFIANVTSQSTPTPPKLASTSPRSEVKTRVVRSAQIRLMELAAAKTRTKVNVSVHKRLLQRPVETDAVKRRARLLLQAAGFLDIEKTIEHLPADTRSPLTPQLRWSGKGLKGCPVVEPLPCGECKRPIRGSMFNPSGRRTSICEDCYWEHHYGDPTYTKKYKHSVASEGVFRVSNHSRCSSCRRRQNTNLRPYALGSGREVHMLADAKYFSVQAQKKTVLSKPTPLAKIIQEDYTRRSAKYDAAWRTGDMRLVGEEWLYKDFVQENPWKNIRVAVRVGPLVFENGSEE